MSKYFLSVVSLFGLIGCWGYVLPADERPRASAHLTQKALDIYFDTWIWNSYDELLEVLSQGLFSFNRERFNMMWQRGEALVINGDPEAATFFRIMLLAPEPWGSLIILRAVRLICQDRESIIGKRIIAFANELIGRGHRNMIPALARPDYYRAICAMKSEFSRLLSLRTRFFFTPLVQAIEEYRARHLGAGASAGGGAPAGAASGYVDDAGGGASLRAITANIPAVPSTHPGAGVGVNEVPVATDDEHYVAEGPFVPVVPTVLVGGGDNAQETRSRRLLKCLQYLVFCKCCKSQTR
ncbi:MAG: hypothetical protein WCJ17_04140 [bacterium]